MKRSWCEIIINWPLFTTSLVIITLSSCLSQEENNLNEPLCDVRDTSMIGVWKETKIKGMSIGPVEGNSFPVNEARNLLKITRDSFYLTEQNKCLRISESYTLNGDQIEFPGNEHLRNYEYSFDDGALCLQKVTDLPQVSPYKSWFVRSNEADTSYLFSLIKNKINWKYFRFLWKKNDEEQDLTNDKNSPYGVRGELSHLPIILDLREENGKNLKFSKDSLFYVDDGLIHSMTFAGYHYYGGTLYLKDHCADENVKVKWVEYRKAWDQDNF